MKVTQDLEARGIPYKYEPDCLVYDLPVKGATCKKCGAPGVTRVAHYTPDLKFDNGTYVELKGKFTSSNRTRMLAFKSSRPSVVLRVLFQRDNYLTKRHAKTYTEWATAHGFVCAVGESVPEAWTK